ncbi:3-oxoacid CoA-transferase subunit B [Pseudomaricurvus alkylphenolicus]|jgi:3-oxoacid CoA-transferase|uniref:3-oxoacid CoA-transferase n=1 Tax=Pseudomaricurvus alkylphenolicus TaxID=1306991 RepID=UPI00141EF75E|nr:3-oxoacid CoA-transferase [Pseudomaricurvus alkylphenolicus]NIB40382.1 3-oxoacid CoA-transferase subunit B [Pseudomaricurvus alkylphenolicus]
MKSVPQISLEQAAALINNGDTIIAGGFGMTGNPVHLLHALAETETRDLTYVGNNVGEPGLGGGRLLRNGQLRKAVGSYFTSNPEAVRAAQCNELEVELLPQGTLGEAIRAGGAGLGGFFTPTSAGTALAQGRESRVIDGREMVFIPPLRGQVSLVRAWKADTAGNLQYRMTESNFNQAAATASDLVIAEVEEIVAVGELDPNAIHTPGCFVDYLVQAHTREEDLGSSASVSSSLKKVDSTRMHMARAALQELNPGDVVNLGIGIPTLVADLIGPETGIVMHTENGMLGVGPEPESGGAMDYPVNAGKIPVTALPGASYFDSTTSFAMIRGGHVDVAIMGGLQVDAEGNLANWAVPGKPLLGVGGAMDLASGADKLVVTMLHTDKQGNTKVKRRCDLPLTAKGVVDVLITDLAVFHFRRGRMTLVRLLPGVSVEQVRECTEAEFDLDLM